MSRARSAASVLVGLAAVVAFDVAGEFASGTLGVPLPGPVIGMTCLLVALVAWRGLAERIERGAAVLLRHMSLFFVPAGVGVMTQFDLLRVEWLPIAIALVGSTLLAIAAAAFAFTKASRRT